MIPPNNPPSYGEMCRRQASIPKDERCEKCDGMGWLDVGCTLTSRVYWGCLRCGGSGKKSDTLPEVIKRINEARKNPR
jgi:hypothetical protein